MHCTGMHNFACHASTCASYLWICVSHFPLHSILNTMRIPFIYMCCYFMPYFLMSNKTKNSMKKTILNYSSELNKLWINLRKFATKLHHIRLLFILYFSLSLSFPCFFFTLYLRNAKFNAHHRLQRRHRTEKHVCTPEEFTCKSSEGECIPMSWVCDGNQDCSNGSDETTCSECFFSSSPFSCFVVIVKKSFSSLDAKLFNFQIFNSRCFSNSSKIIWNSYVCVHVGNSIHFCKMCVSLFFYFLPRKNQIKLVVPTNLHVPTVDVFR